MNHYLFVCSVNMCRSPTAEHVSRLLGYSADSAGTAFHHNPVRPLTVEAIERAEHIVCMEQDHADVVTAMCPDAADRVQVWCIPDNYNYCDGKLIDMIRTRLSQRDFTHMTLNPNTA